MDKMVQAAQEPENEEFLTTGEYQFLINVLDPDAYFSLRLILSDHVTNYSRRTYSLLDLLGDLGGIQGALVSIGFAITSSISGLLFT